jgi:hypothetical protein
MRHDEQFTFGLLFTLTVACALLLLGFLSNGGCNHV